MSLLAHVLGPCEDPDCEIHRIEVGLEEETVKSSELAFFIAGAQAVRSGMPLKAIERLGHERIKEGRERMRS